MVKVLKVDPIRPEADRIALAARVLRRGGTVAFPTETVYGLGANCFSDSACSKIFAAKGRQPDNPLIVHLSTTEELPMVAREVPPSLEELLKRLWPGPLSVVLPKRDEVSQVASAGLPTVAVRVPAHPVALALIREAGVPVAAPSANTSTRPSPTRASHVIDDLGAKIDIILDGGEAFFGIESTVIRPSGSGVEVLRPGPFTLDELRKHFGTTIVAESNHSSGAPPSPGMKYLHYSPKKPLVLADSVECIKALNEELTKRGLISETICTSDQVQGLAGPTRLLGSGEDIYEVAKNLYSAIRDFDQGSSDIGIISAFPEEGIGFAIMNRIRKACGDRVAEHPDQVKKLCDLLDRNRGGSL